MDLICLSQKIKQSFFSPTGLQPVSGISEINLIRLSTALFQKKSITNE